MDATTMVGLTALLALSMVCTILILWCKYNDGIVGKIGFAMVALGAMALFTGEAEGEPPAFTPAETFIYCGMALAMGRHLWRRLPRLTGRAPSRRKADRS